MTTEYLNTLPFLLYGRIVGGANAALARAPEREDPYSGFYHTVRGDVWTPEQTDDTTIQYTRAHHPQAKIIAKNLQIANIADITWSQPVVINSSNEERHAINVRVPAGQSFQTRLQHTFSETTSLLEAAHVGLKLGFETTFGYKSGTATGGPEGSQKITGELSASYDRTWGSTSKTERTVDITLPVNGPFIGTVSLVRSTADLEVTTEVSPNFEFQIEVQDNGRTLYKWDSYATLIRVLRGEAPTDRALASKFIYDPIKGENTPASTALIRSLESRKLPKVHFANRYNDVSNISVQFIPDLEAMGDTKPAKQEEVEVS